ncbi:hypothetical protein B0H19DRAFT_1079159 [Mycena capillaripes]|nr:hypothetical protein B0H19DRAFT_1079159 [Mycena capillaripes]
MFTALPFPTLPLFLARSACVLEHLGLRFRNGPPELIACLEGMSSLVSLRIDVSGKISRFADVMSTDPPLLPRLSILVILASYDHFDYFALTQLLQIRRSGDQTARLDSVELILHDTPGSFEHEDGWLPRAAVIEFCKLLDQGLDFRVIYNKYKWPTGRIDDCESFQNLYC